VASLSVSTGTDIVGKTTSLVCRQEFKCLRCANLNQSLFGIPPYAAGQRWVVGLLPRRWIQNPNDRSAISVLGRRC
jgi:hypothetical protein